MDSTEKNRIKLLAQGVQGRARRYMPRRPNVPFPYGPPPTPNDVDRLPSVSTLGENFGTDWARRPSARAARVAYLEGVMRPAIKLVAQPTRTNRDRLASLSAGETAIFVANHHSHVDTPLLITSIPDPWRHRLVVAAAADHFFDKRFKGAWSALSLNAVPMERSKTSRVSINRASDLLSDGWSVLLYPEGGRSKDGWGQEFKAGAAYLAQRCDVPVVPIHVTGTGSILRKGKTMPTPARTTVNFGVPLRAEPDESSRHFNERISTAVSVLADETASDWWQARQRQHSGNVPALTGPEAGAWRRQWALGDRTRALRRPKKWPYA